jgi:hypothetical protein
LLTHQPNLLQHPNRDALQALHKNDVALRNIHVGHFQPRNVCWLHFIITLSLACPILFAFWRDVCLTMRSAAYKESKREVSVEQAVKLNLISRLAVVITDYADVVTRPTLPEYLLTALISFSQEVGSLDGFTQQDACAWLLELMRLAAECTPTVPHPFRRRATTLCWPPSLSAALKAGDVFAQGEITVRDPDVEALAPLFWQLDDACRVQKLGPGAPVHFSASFVAALDTGVTLRGGELADHSEKLREMRVIPQGCAPPPMVAITILRCIDAHGSQIDPRPVTFDSTIDLALLWQGPVAPPGTTYRLVALAMKTGGARAGHYCTAVVVGEQSAERDLVVAVDDLYPSGARLTSLKEMAQQGKWFASEAYFEQVQQ